MRLKVDERARKGMLEAGLDCWLPPLLHLASMAWRRRQRDQQGGGEWQVSMCMVWWLAIDVAWQGVCCYV